MNRRCTAYGLLLLLLALSPFLSFGQHDWVWTFGDSVVMRFPNGGTPAVSLTEKSRRTFEAGACYSDELGNLRIFVNEDSIFNGQYYTIQNGILLNIWDSFTQGVIIIPDPAGDNLFRIFTHSFHCANTGNTRCLWEYQVLAEGVGGINKVVSRALLGYPGTSVSKGLSEKLAACKHADGESWWILVHDIDNNSFYRYLLTSSGISAPERQDIGSPHAYIPGNAYYAYGEMLFSQDGSKLLVANASGVMDVFEFDRCTGELSNWLELGEIVPRGPGNYYGASFSPDGSKVYGSDMDLPYNSRLWQWDLNTADPKASRAELIHDISHSYWGQHQLGPDGKIYITAMSPDLSQSCNGALSVIHDPNQAGTACNFQHLGLSLQGRRTSFNLPNLPNYSLGPLLKAVADAGPRRVVVCPGDSVLLGGDSVAVAGVSYMWSGPGTEGATNPQVWATQTGWHTLTVVDSGYGVDCGRTVDRVEVVWADSTMVPVAWAGEDRMACPEEVFGLGEEGNSLWEYAWNPATGLSHPDSAWTVATDTGAYVVTVRNPAVQGECLVARDTVQVGWHAEPLLGGGFAGMDTTVCIGDSVFLGVPHAGWIWEWEGGLGTSVPLGMEALETMGYVLVARDSASGGQCWEYRDTVAVRVEDIASHPRPEAEVAFCPGEAVEIGVGAVAGFSYRWEPREGLQDWTASRTVAAPKEGLVYVLVAVGDTHLTRCGELRMPVALVTDGCAVQDVLTPNGDGVNDVLDLGTHAGAVRLAVYDRWGAEVFTDSGYSNGWGAEGLPEGVYWYVAEAGGRRWAGVVTVVR